MIAAIYARKSTDQTGVAEDQKSVTRQLEHARAYAARKSWTVDESSVFIDDGVSGAEFANRPGFLRLMNALKPHPAFGVLVMSEESRLGRESIETAFSLKQLVRAGVRVFFYLEDRERTLDSPMDKIMLSLTAFGDEIERERGRQRTTDAMMRKARAGHVCGGRVFGYDNVEVPGSHFERRINEAEAAVVRRIFELSAAGTGFTRTAKLLNHEHALTPRPQGGRPAGWSPSTVRDVLNRSTYRGEVVWNRSRKRNSWGQQQQVARPEAEWIVTHRPELRIVDDDVWNAAHDRLRGIRQHLMTTNGERPIIHRDCDSKYLLAGHARCAQCGGTLSVVSRQHGRQRKFFYGCLAFSKRGTSVCENDLVMPIEVVNDAVLQAIRGDVLRPAVIRAIVAEVFAALTPTSVARNLSALRRDLHVVDQKIANLTVAIEDGAAVAPLVAQLTTRQQEREVLLGEIGAAEGRAAIHQDRPMVEAKVLAQCARWRALLTEEIEDGRQLLREVLDGPLKFTAGPGKQYRFSGNVMTGQLVAGLVSPKTPPEMASPAGMACFRVVGLALRRAA